MPSAAYRWQWRGGTGREGNYSVTDVYLSLGCNLGDCRATLAAAIAGLEKNDVIGVEAVSSLYLTEPVGMENQPRFTNLVIKLETELPPAELRRVCHEIEVELGGRRERQPMGPRTIDIDIILYGDRRLVSAELTIPHPRMLERAFVLEPLVEISPDVVIPGSGTAREALHILGSSVGVEKTGRLEEFEQR